MRGIQNKNIYISESIYYTHVWITPLQRETMKVFFLSIQFYQFQCGLLWCHDKYPDGIRSRSTLLEACLVLP
jgi:hypothetical protein